MDKDVMQQLQELKRNYKRLKTIIAVSACLLITGVLTLSFVRENKFGLIRAKGIIIEDETGRDRILIGAPIPPSKDRVRTDTALVRKFWAGKFRDPNQYMKWYAAYKNSAEGIVFMNDKGFDVVQVGDNLSDANVGVRMFRSTGILWNTQDGWERGGAGVNTTKDGKSRPVIGLDDDSGEAMHLVCLEDGSKALIIGDEKGSMRIGMASKEGELFQNKTHFTGVRYFDKADKLVWEQQMNTTK